MKKWILLLIAAAGVFFGFKYAKDDGPTSFQVQYKIECASCTVTYKNDKGETVTEKSVNSSWTKNFTCKKGQFVYLSGQNNSDEGNVKVQIIANGEVVGEGTSESPFELAKAGKML